jgi:hypothetical protein
MIYSIKEPKWKTAGCVARRAIDSPEGWIGLRQDSRWWAVTGVDHIGWREFGVFKTEEEAEQFALTKYYEQIEKLVKRWLE